MNSARQAGEETGVSSWAEENEKNLGGKTRFPPRFFFVFQVRFVHPRPAPLAAQEQLSTMKSHSGALLVA